MGKVKLSVKNERLCIDFEDRIRPVFVKGQTEGDLFHVRAEDFELFSGLSDSDINDMRDAIKGSNIIID